MSPIFHTQLFLEKIHCKTSRRVSIRLVGFVAVIRLSLTFWAVNRQWRNVEKRFSASFRGKIRSSGVNFINVLPTAFMLVDPESAKNYWWLNCIFCAFGIYECKSCTLNVDEIDPRIPWQSWSKKVQIWEAKMCTEIHLCRYCLLEKTLTFLGPVRSYYT